MKPRSVASAIPPVAGPWRTCNRFRLFTQGNRFFPAMLEAIAGARERVALEIYWIETGMIAGRFIDALIEATGRGVETFVLIDDFGSSELAVRDRRRLTAAGVHLARYNPLRFRLGWGNLARDHRKILLIDDRYAFVGGAGISDEFDRADGWRENMLRIEGECVADWWALFAGNWQCWSDYACTPPRSRRAGNMPGRVVAGPGRLGRRPIERAAVRDITRARRRVWLATPYFLPPIRLRQALVRARRGGADVRLLIPAAQSCDLPAVQAAGQRWYEWFLQRGVRIFEYRERVTHQKVLLADERVLIGSANFDRWGLRWHLEANQAVHSRVVAEHTAGMLKDDFAVACELQLADWRQRSFLARLRERFWGRLEALGARIAYRQRVVQVAREQAAGRRRECVEGDH
ncbi:MAG: phospholipase D-like domain-containing protein [Halofilum sp. (in: g-proteobacteria)]